MKALVTGAAGFVGSHTSEALLRLGHEVRGVDALTDYYDPMLKKANVQVLQDWARFDFRQADLLDADLAGLLDGVDVVFHLAAQPGVRSSWQNGFGVYAEANVMATQRLLEAARLSEVRRFVYASSSSVYGRAARYPTSEDAPTRPFSPYGVTKLAAEHLCTLYADNWGLPTVSLRYFTVYGPRQRPDMAMNRFIAAALEGHAIPVYGDGEQVRDFTFVQDVVAASLAAAEVADLAPGAVVNVAGGGSITVNGLVELLQTVVGRPVHTAEQPRQPGDVLQTGGTIDLAERLLGWRPQVAVPEGLAHQVAWQQSLLG
ncbi:Nucleoside-diphosphate-sugar epimerase [Modestobacter sp. DSM 44400]|uniref:NAD-dependent epimerase/dehydratase family protein n=1 Tax=Modestobacter sp. DSM 44400 TaxID=1550230 RepID=UPI000897A32C|nr:NAD-dependent epimerase/dehydratase family protein [Modestobacter sp. DSM 44400]SDY66859.1 Nucleoside-diphosphate-sugar epimerase [Modestobacter sp. DSM 44400]